jgi:ketosteroid isomerase-like protein
VRYLQFMFRATDHHRRERAHRDRQAWKRPLAPKPEHPLRPPVATMRRRSQEKVEIVRAVYKPWSEGDFGARVDLFDDHLVFVPGAGSGDDGAYLGTEAIAAYTRGRLEPWARLTVEAEEIVPAGDSVLVRVHQRGVRTAVRVPWKMRYFQLWSFRGDKVIRLESFRKRVEALEAAGLRE